MMATQRNPTFLFVSGAFHGIDCFNELGHYLIKSGYNTRGTALASAGNASATLEDDIQTIRDKHLIPVIEAGKEVIVVFHSFGGLPGSVAIKGLAKADRPSEHGGIVGLVYVCAFIPHQGDSLLTAIGGKWEPWQHEKDGLVLVSDADKIFYADVEESKIPGLVADLRGHSVKALKVPCPAPAYAEAGFDGRRAYIRCTEDRAIPIFAQDAMIEHSGCEWIKKELKSGHSPFLSQPEALSKVLIELAELWSS